MKVSGSISSILFAAFLIAHRPDAADAFVTHHRHGQQTLRPVTSFGLERATNQPALALFPTRRTAVEPNFDAIQGHAGRSSRRTWKTTVAAVTATLRQTRRIVASLALALCIWLHGHGLIPQAAHAKAPAPPTQEKVVVDTTQAKKSPTKAIVLCGGVVLANELYKRSLKGTDVVSLSSPNEQDNVDEVFTRPIRALEEITPTLTSNTTNATDASASSNMTAVQKIQQQVENVANKVEGKIQEWTATRAPNATADARKATISLKRTSAGTGQLNETIVASETSAPAESLKVPAPRVNIPPPIKTPASPVAKAAPPAAAVNKTPAIPAISPVLAGSVAAATSSATVTPAAKAVATAESSSVKSTVVGVHPISAAVAVTPAAAPVPGAPSSSTTGPTAVANQGKTAASSPLSPMGLGGSDKTATKPTEVPKKPLATEPLEPSPSSTAASGPKHETLRLIGFGNTTFGTPAKVRTLPPKVSTAAGQSAKTQDALFSSTPSSMTASPSGSVPAPVSASDTKPRENREVVAVRSPDEEVALQQKYAAIDDLGERAYQILIDLGMI